MKLPVPKQLDTTVILETYSKNELPFKFSEVQISINGPDIVVKTADGHTMTFPFAAQFATMGKQVFTLVFADGKEIPSDQLLAYVTTVTVAPSVAAPVAHHDEGKGTAEKESSKEVSKEETKTVTKEEIVVVEGPPQETAGADHADAAHKQPPVVHPGDLSKHRFDAEELPRVDHISGMPPKPENPPVESDPALVDETPPPVDVDTTPVDTTPEDTTPVDPTPVDPTPVDPTPVDPTPVDPTPVDPTPVDPTPVDPTPVDPTPVDPTPVDPTPVDPTPVDPTPVDPTPVDPTPVDPTPVDPTPVDPTPVDPTPVDPTPPILKDVVLLETSAVADQTTHEYFLGAGADAARTDGRISTQYGARNVDLSQETANWTIHADSSVGATEPGSMMRIVNAGSVSELSDVSVSADLAAKGVSIILWNSEEGIALGLKSNEFALRYPISKQVLDGAFSIHIDFVDAESGQSGSTDIKFQVIDSPTALRNENDVYQLSRHDNDVSIHGGSGDDTIIAGTANGVYDGGGGVNTLDYSKFTTALSVDLSADVRSALGIAPTGDITVDMGRVKSGDTTNSIENIQIIKGGSGANTFIGNAFDHQFIGGSGDNTFIANGGNNVYTGGGGKNVLDYSRAGTSAFDTVTLGASGRTLVLDGVDIDMSKGVTSNNGWVDANGKSGVDHFSGVNQITGTAHNDRIKGSDGDDVIFGGGGDDLIIGSGGNDTIDGGTGFNTISYAEMTGAVDVDLNRGKAVKNAGGVDTLAHIQAVIGSAGGGSLTGLTGSDNLLIGTDGDTHFVTNAGSNKLYGGAGNNTFDLTQGTNTIVGGAKSNTVNSAGGANTFYAGDGVNVFAANGGNTVYRGGAGTDTFTSTNAGANTMIGGSGIGEFHATGGGSNTITAGAGAMHVFSGGANNTVTGGFGGKVTIDYTAYQGDGRLEISLDRNLALVGNDFVDRLFDIDVIVGNKGGNSTIKGGSKGIEIHVSGDNNLLIGGLGNNIFDGGSGKNNTVDYSGATGAVNVNLETGVVSKNGSGFSDQIYNIQRVIGSNAAGNVFQGKNGANVWIDMGTGANGRVVGSKGNDTYVSHNASSIADYSKLSAGMNLNTTTGVVLKGVNGTDQLTNVFGTIIGTDHGDVIAVANQVNVQAGAGNDKIILTGPAFPTTIDGGGGRNELDATNATQYTGKLIAYMLNADGRSGTLTGMNAADWTLGTASGSASSSMIFKNIDLLDTSNLANNLINWGTGNHVTINGSTNADYFFVNGGGNRIDGRYFGQGETAAAQSASRAIISYNKTSTGLDADFDAGTVSFADGRDSDTITNFSRFRGTTGNDVIKGHANQNDWIIASAGDDSIDAGGGNANVYAVDNNTYHVIADFNTGVISKYDGSNKLVGTDAVNNFQQYYGGNQTDTIYAKNGLDMSFNFGTGGDNRFYTSNANNTIDGGGGNTHLFYSELQAPITVDLTGGRVVKSGGNGTDSFKNIFDIVGTTGDDTFTFSTQADVTKSYLRGGGGQDVLQKTGSTAGTYDLPTMLAKMSDITKIDFSTSTAADKITIDFTSLLTRGNETLTLNTGSKDTITMTHNAELDGWTHTTTVTDGHTTDTYSLGGHQLIWNH